MRLNRICVLTFLLIVTATGVLKSQPSNGDFWASRANEYARMYCNTINPEYGPPPQGGTDCARFASQCAQAGCAGLCEWNNNPNPSYPNSVPIGNFGPCQNYWDQQPLMSKQDNEKSPCHCENNSLP
jgi:hypothetical protein